MAILDKIGEVDMGEGVEGEQAINMNTNGGIYITDSARLSTLASRRWLLWRSNLINWRGNLQRIKKCDFSVLPPAFFKTLGFGDRHSS